MSPSSLQNTYWYWKSAIMFCNDWSVILQSCLTVVSLHWKWVSIGLEHIIGDIIYAWDTISLIRRCPNAGVPFLVVLRLIWYWETGGLFLLCRSEATMTQGTGHESDWTSFSHWTLTMVRGNQCVLNVLAKALVIQLLPASLLLCTVPLCSCYDAFFQSLQPPHSILP